MKRSLVISDLMYRLVHSVKRNRFWVIVYVLLCLLFLVVGIAVGVNVFDKNEFVLRNGAVIFKFLRGDTGIVAFLFIDLLLSCVYCLFAASMFLYKPLTFLSLMPCLYRSYVLGMNVSVIIAVFSVSSVPMLFVLYVPVCIVEITVMCMLSFRCFAFYALNNGCTPSRVDIKCYYKGLLQYFFVIVACVTVKSITLVLFGSALIGII